MKKILLACLMALPLVAISQTVVINEINCDNPGGPDTQEFVELYGSPGFALDSLVFVYFDGQSGVSYSALDLDGYMLDENGFFVIGNANTANVDLIIGNATMQNGQDAVAIYHADATDFPDGTTPLTTDLIEAAVYGTGDQTATNLITGLGLDVIIPGYAQLDETVQQTGQDNSLSRIPDGGDAFVNTSFILQGVTPGTWNVPQCLGGEIAFSDLTSSVSLCDNESGITLEFAVDGSAYGDSIFYVLTDGSDQILEVLAGSTYQVNNMLAGTYFIYGVAYNDSILESSLTVGAPVAGISSTSCVSLSANALEIVINSCSGCLGGEMSDSNGSDVYAGCALQSSTIDFVNTSTSLEASYIYIIADANDLIVTTSTGTVDVGTLPAGSFVVYGASYVGTIDPASVMEGMPASGVTSSVCIDYALNTYTITLYDCVLVDPCTELFFSEYLEGNNGSKALEIFNPSSNTIDLSSYSVLQYSNGSLTATDTLYLTGSLAPYEVYIIANPGGGGGPGGGAADAEVLAAADVIDVIANFSGNDAVVLRNDSVIIDVIGVVGENPGNQSGWPVGNGSTRNTNLVRQAQVQSPTNIWAISETQWNVFDAADYSHLGYHLFDPCGSLVIAGIVTEDLSVDENIGTVSFNVLYENVTNTSTIDILLTGTVNGSDYVLTAPTQITTAAGEAVVAFSFDIIDDLDLENDETINFTLSSSEDIYWIDQAITITILANDLNCDGGNIQLVNGNGPVVQCSDLPNTAVDVANNTSMPAADYIYVVTNVNDGIMFIAPTSPIDMDALGEGIFHIYGLSFTGTLDATTTESNDLVQDILSDTCSSLSANFITVIRSACIITGCDGAEVSLSDGSTIMTICSDDISDSWELATTTASIDANYTYVVANDNDLIVQLISSPFDFNTLSVGNYHVYGLSYLGELDATTTEVGLAVTGISSSDCTELSANNIQINVADCSAVPSCTFLFFSEVVEDTQSNKALELYNPTDSDIDLSAYTIQQYQDGANAPTATLTLSGTLASHEVYVVLSNGNGQTQADALLIAAADMQDAVASFTGNDAFELLYQGSVVDRIGVVGENPGNFGWDAGNFSTSNQVLVRRPEVIAGNPDWTITSGQWIGYPQADFSHIGAHEALSCTTPTTPMAGFELASLSVDETVGTITVNVIGSDVSADITLIMSVSGTAANSVDYNAVFPVVITFPAGTSTQSFDISVINDLLLEGDETIVLSLTSSSVFTWTNQEMTITISDPVGIEEFNISNVNIFPNPASDLLQVSSDDIIDEYHVFHADGQLVYSGNANGSKAVRIDTATLSQGYYYITVKTTRSVSRKAFNIVK